MTYVNKKKHIQFCKKINRKTIKFDDNLIIFKKPF